MLNACFGVCFVIRNKIDVPKTKNIKKYEKLYKRRAKKKALSNTAASSSIEEGNANSPDGVSGDILNRYGTINASGLTGVSINGDSALKD